MRRDIGLTALAFGRLGLGAVAVAAPRLPVRAWLGSADGTATAVLGRALGGRDLALAAGALAAVRTGDTIAVRRWALAGALSDGIDALVTVGCWSSLPRVERVAVLVASAGAAVIGLAAAR